jgi:4-hydroxy-tetrahydrodipicolinate synthase
MSVETMAKLAKMPTIVGVKDASGKVERVSAQRLACGPDFCQLSGNDDMALGFMAMGGVGCISVTANVAPGLCADFQAAVRGRALGRCAGVAGSAVPAACGVVQRCLAGPGQICADQSPMPDFPDELRLPMTWPSEASRAAVDAALAHAGLI